MSDFDYDKIKDMEYDTVRKCYVGKNGEEFHVSRFADGSGYKYDYYDRSPYGNAKHNSTHVKSDLNENWERTDNDRDNGTQEKSSGSGCYLTTACMRHFNESFDDNCYELTILRWFRDNFVLKEDIEHYYDVAPMIVEAIDKEEKSETIYDYIYDNIVDYCTEQIVQGNYDAAYNRYKNSVIVLENQFTKAIPQQRFVKILEKSR